MTRSGQFAKRRSRVLYLVLIGFAILLARLVHLQIIRHEYYSTLANQQHMERRTVQEARGDILDRRGLLLATSYRGHSIFVDPKIVDRDKLAEFCEFASKVLEMPASKIMEICSDDRSRFSWIKRHLNTEQTRQLTPYVNSVRGLSFQEEWRRFYPLSKAMSPVLGVVGTDQYGLAGLEMKFDRQLRSHPGQIWSLRDARHRRVSLRPVKQVAAKRGNDLILTIDRCIQTFLYREMEAAFTKYKPASASGMVMDVRTGEILALASLPAHDPGQAIQPGMLGLIPHMVTDVFEPGSTMKPIMYAAMLMHGLGTPEESVFCGNGEKKFNQRTIHDVHHYANLSFEDVIVKSSNIGAAYMGLRLGNERMYNILSYLGFGQKSFLPFAGEAPGKLYPLKQWTDYSTTSVPMGHEISANMVQMLTSYCAIANGGYVIQPYLVGSILSPVGGVLDQGEPLTFHRAFDSKTCSLVTRALEQVVERGTARAAKSTIYKIAGKTGTSEKFVNGKYDKTKNIALFVGFAPVSAPRIAIMVIFDEPQGASFGGVVAAPVASKTLDETLLYLGIEPENGV